MRSTTAGVLALTVVGTALAAAAAVFFGGSSEGSVLAGDDATPTEEATEDEGEGSGDDDANSEEQDDDGEDRAEADDEERPFADFLSVLAENLGISTDELEEALRQTKLDLIDQAEADGNLSAERADELRQAVEDGDLGFPFGFGRFGGGFGFGGPGGPGGHFALGFVQPDELAEFLGLEVNELFDSQAEGTTLAALAEANGQTRQELIDFLSAPALERIDQALADGEISEDEAAERRERLNDSIEQLIDASFNAEECEDTGFDMEEGDGLPFRRGFCFRMEFNDGDGVEEAESAFIT